MPTVVAAAGTIFTFFASPAFAGSSGFEGALRAACAEGRGLARAGGLAHAHSAYASLAKAAPGYRCRGVAVTTLLRRVKAAEKARARAAEVARTYRRAATVGERHRSPRAVRRWRVKSYRHYLRGLEIEPAAKGPRKGLRTLLAAYPVFGAEHCHRATALLGLRLLREARQEYVRAIGAGSACGAVEKALIEQRSAAYQQLHDGLARERAGDGPGARRHYIGALEIDPGSSGALAGLSRVAPPLPSKAPQPALTTRLVGGPCGRDGARRGSSGPRPQFLSVVTLVVGADDPRVRRMRNDRDRGEDFREARDDLLARFGLPMEREQLGKRSNNAQQGAAELTLTVDRAMATVAIRARATVFERRAQYVWPWIVERADDGLRLRLAVQRPPPGVQRRAEVTSCGWRLAGVFPAARRDAPSGQDDDLSLVWEIASDRLGPRPRMTLDIPVLDRLALNGSRVANVFRIAGALIVPFALLVLALFVLRGVAAGRRTRLASVIGVAALVVIVADWILVYAAPLDQAWRAATGIVTLAVIAGLVATTAWPSSAPGRALLTLGLIVAAVAAAWFPFVSEVQSADALGVAKAAMAVVLVVVTVYAMLAIATHAAATGWGRPVPTWQRRWRWALSGSIVAVAAGDATLYLLQRRAAWWNTPIYFEGGHRETAEWLGDVVRASTFEPLAILDTAPLLVMVAAGLLLAALRLRHGGRVAEPLFSDRRSHLAVKFMFVGVAIGSSAPVLGFPIPVALALALLYVWRVRSRAMERADAHAREAGSASAEAGAVLASHRVELLDRAAAAQRQVRIEQDLRAKYAAGDTNAVANEQALEERLKESRARSRQLERGGAGIAPPPPVTVPLPARATPGTFALALGPKGDWWANGVRSVELAWPLALVPIGFSVYVIADGIIQRAPEGFLFESPLGVAASILRESLFWLVSAFSLGALLPYLPFRNAPMKGLALAGAYILPLAVLHTTAGLVDALTEVGRVFHLELSDWTFRGFELLLFLMAVGVRLDGATVSHTKARLVPMYGLDDIRAAIVYLAPVVVTVGLVGSQLFRGEATNALQTILESAGSLLPSGVR
jgi:hypothetical protein